jgi:hypothetical protein
MLEKQPTGGRGYDWTMVLLSFWFVAGAFLDGWAHNHIPELETFFTPWHALFYSGFLAVAAFLMATLFRHHAKGYPWRHGVPSGYELSLLGVLVFVAGGVGDMIWHELFGIEANIEALLSPTHLALALGGTLIVSGPFRAAWRWPSGRNDHALGWRALLPALLSLTFVLSLWGFMTQFAHPLVDPWAAAGFRPRSQQFPVLRQSFGVVSILFHAGLLMGPVLLLILRWILPLGSLTLVFVLNATLMSFMQDQYRFIPAAALGGIAADLLLRWLRPCPVRVGALRFFAFAVPAIYWALYFVAVLVTQGLAWSVHLWTGSIVLAGVVGLLLSYLLVPPAHVSEHMSAASPAATVSDTPILRR